MQELCLPKKQLLKIISDLLFKEEDKYWDEKQDTLIIKNTQLMCVPVPMGVKDIQVLHYGKMFNTTDVIPGLDPRITTFVHDDLIQKFETLWEDKLIYGTEKRQIQEFIRELLNCCDTFPDMILLLPKIIRKSIIFYEEYSNLSSKIIDFIRKNKNASNSIFNDVNLNTEYVNSFQAKHILKLDLIKQRILINLIDT